MSAQNIDKLAVEIAAISGVSVSYAQEIRALLSPIFRERDEALARVETVKHDLGVELQVRSEKADALVGRLKARIKELKAALAPFAACQIAPCPQADANDIWLWRPNSSGANHPGINLSHIFAAQAALKGTL